MWTLAERAAGRSGGFQEVAAIAEQALEAPGLPQSWRARIECWYAIALRFIGPSEQARRIAEDSLAHALAGGDPLSIAYARHAIHWCAPSDAATELLAQAGAALGEDVESAELRIMISTNDGMLRYRTVRDPAVRETIMSGLLVLTERTTAARAALTFGFAAGISFEAGRWDEALGYLAGMDPEVAAMPFYLDNYGLLALIHLLRGDVQAAERELAEVDRVLADPEIAQNANRLLVEYVISARALMAETTGDPAGAFALLEESLLDEMPVEIRGPRFAVFVPELVRLGLLVGRLDAVERTVRVLEQLHETDRSLGLAGAWEHAEALLAGDPVALIAAADTYGSGDLRLRQAYALEEAAVLFAKAGSAEQARAALTNGSAATRFSLVP